MTIKFSTKDLFKPANILSLLRIPIAAVMMLIYSNRAIFFSMLVLAILTDILDGYVARKTKPTPFGTLLDPLCDKIFFGSLLIFLFFTSSIDGVQLFFLLLRDIFVAGLVAFFYFGPKKELLESKIKARWPGKIVTVAQFVALIWFFIGLDNFFWVVSAVAAVSIVAIIDYAIFVKKEISK